MFVFLNVWFSELYSSVLEGCVKIFKKGTPPPPGSVRTGCYSPSPSWCTPMPWARWLPASMDVSPPGGLRLAGAAAGRH